MKFSISNTIVTIVAIIGMSVDSAAISGNQDQTATLDRRQWYAGRVNIGGGRTVSMADYYAGNYTPYSSNTGTSSSNNQANNYNSPSQNAGTTQNNDQQPSRGRNCRYPTGRSFYQVGLVCDD